MKRFYTVLAFLIAAALLAWNVSGARVNSDAADAHKRADAVLWPQFIATSNDWALNHGQLSDPGHVDKIDAKDKKRFDAACEAFKAWHDAMVEAGY
jgi:hypothetical protein